MLRRLLHRLPEPVVQGLRWGRRQALLTRERIAPPALVHPARPAVDLAAPVRLLIGPANFAGQAWAWSRAAERELPGVSATAMAVARGGLSFARDYDVPVPVYQSLRWQREQLDAVRSTYTHVLMDALRPVLGNRYGEDCRHDLEVLRRAGLQVGLIAHGSDIRVAALHRELYPHSPWNDPAWDYGRRLDAKAVRLSALMNAYDGPTFVSTPDLLDFAPRASWLPTVVELAPWQTDAPVLRRPVPVVLHVPSNPRLKGSHLVDPLLQNLHRQGRIDYRRLEKVPPGDMPGLVAEADVVLDQFVLGLYSVMAIQGLAAGRLVVAHVHERVRARTPVPLPVVEASPDDLVAVLERVLTDRESFREVAAAGPAYAQEVHDGRRSARVLAPFLGLG